MESSSWPWQHLPIVLDSTNQASFASVDWLLILLLLGALLLAAGSAAAETALTSASRIKLRKQAEEGDVRAQRTLLLVERPQNVLSTILVVSNVSVIVASTAATILAISIFVSFGEVISTVVLSFVVLIFCEITPKTIAVQSPETWAKRLSGPVERVSFVLRPIVSSLTFITRGIVRLFGGGQVHHGPFVTEEELRLLVEVGEEEGVLEEEEREMIHNVFELADTSVREIMVPRIDMVTISGTASFEEAMDLIVQGGQSRIPVYDGSIDNIIGVLYAKDLLRILRMGQQPREVSGLVRPAYFVPESKRLDDLLRELQQQHVHMAIVIDEYGSVSGLVTIEDLVEEIIGDIQDEYDREEQLLERISDDEFLVDAKISLDELNEELDTRLSSEDYDTLGGFVYGHLDKIPTVGDSVQAGGFNMTVVSTKGRRVTKVRLVREPSGAPASTARSDDQDPTTAPLSSSTSIPPAPERPPALLSGGASEQAPLALPPASPDMTSNTPAPSDTPGSAGSGPEDQEVTAPAAPNNTSRPLRSRYTDARRAHNHHTPPGRRRP
jgi:CBS domain containing-hemolysin-like protein